MRPALQFPALNQNAQKELLLVRKKGEWFGQVKLRPGKYAYVFHIDDTWLTDPFNSLAVKGNKYYSSLIIVR
jgi:hypothetical protein